MEIKFADTFGESLQRMADRTKWYWKTWDFFRLDIPRFFKNVWLFRKALANYYWWDHHGTLMFMETGLSHMAENLEKRGNEVEVSRFKKIAAIKRATEIIRNYNESNYIDMAEAELGELYHRDWEWEETGETTDNPFGEKDEKLYRLVDNETPIEKKHNRKVYTRAREIEEHEWKELFTILQGQNHKEYTRLYKKAKKEGTRDDKDLWNNWFDGSGIKGWWD
jgi:hypothetical protein